MMPMRMPGISSPRRVTVLLTLRRTCVRQGYMLPVVSKLKTTSTAGLDMQVPPGGRNIMPRPRGGATSEGAVFTLFTIRSSRGGQVVSEPPVECIVPSTHLAYQPGDPCLVEGLPTRIPG